MLPPEEVLLQAKNAPTRYEEYDIYMSHERDLPDGGRGILPDSDLLKSVHAYTSHFYHANSAGPRDGYGPGGRYYKGMGNVSMESMDETALLAFGILLEEAGREALGRTGDLVFTEADDEITTGATDVGAPQYRTKEHIESPQRKRRKLQQEDSRHTGP